MGQALAIGDDTGLTKVLVTGDEHTALRGAIPRNEESAISGTGMIARAETHLRGPPFVW